MEFFAFFFDYKYFYWLLLLFLLYRDTACTFYFDSKLLHFVWILKTGNGRIWIIALNTNSNGYVLLDIDLT